MSGTVPTLLRVILMDHAAEVSTNRRKLRKVSAFTVVRGGAISIDSQTFSFAAFDASWRLCLIPYQSVFQMN
jgi:hypothetical protein